MLDREKRSEEERVKKKQGTVEVEYTRLSSCGYQLLVSIPTEITPVEIKYLSRGKQCTHHAWKCNLSQATWNWMQGLSSNK